MLLPSPACPQTVPILPPPFVSEFASFEAGESCGGMAGELERFVAVFGVHVEHETGEQALRESVRAGPESKGQTATPRPGARVGSAASLLRTLDGQDLLACSAEGYTVCSFPLAEPQRLVRQTPASSLRSARTSPPAPQLSRKSFDSPSQERTFRHNTGPADAEDMGSLKRAPFSGLR